MKRKDALLWFLFAVGWAQLVYGALDDHTANVVAGFALWWLAERFDS